MESLTKCLQIAKEAGVPRDQAERLIKSGYIPLPWQWEFHAAAREADKTNGPVDIGTGGARGPGKSHAVLSQVGLDDCQRFSKLKGLFLRQTSLAAKESFDDLIDKTLRGRVDYERSGNILKFNNGSRVILGGFKDEKDIDKYVGIEYDFIVVEELNQLTESKYEKLRGSLRTSKDGWRPRMYTSFNPGGVGHEFVKNRYILPFRNGTERETRFIGSTYKSNVYLNVEYVGYLEGLGGDLGKAWREGEWDIFAGQYFSEFRYDIHVVDPYQIPPHWPRIVMGDYGYSKPSAVYWGAIDEDGNLVLYRELYVTGHTFEQLATAICSNTGHNEEIKYWVFDPAIWSKKDSPVSGAETMMKTYKDIMGRSINMIQANNDRVIGWNTLRDYLKPYLQGEKIVSKLRIFSTCINLIRTLPTLVYDKIKVEDLDSDGEDHSADAVRYGVMSRPPIAPSTKYGVHRLLGSNRNSISNANTSYE